MLLQVKKARFTDYEWASAADGIVRSATPPTPASLASHATRSVAFIPLSPQSQQTLLYHHCQHGENSEDMGPPDLNPGADEVEVLPNRFDAAGRPLSGAGPGWRRGGETGRRVHTRRGDFEYRSPRGDGQIHGDWGVAGTDGEAVERIVRQVTGALEGRTGWMGLLAGLLGGWSLEARAEGTQGDVGGRREAEEHGGEGSSRGGRGTESDRPRDGGARVCGREELDDDFHDNYNENYDDRKRRRKGPSRRGVREAL